MMGISAKPKISVLTPEELLGPLNDVEKKYAPLKLFASGPMEIPVPRPRLAIIGSRKASGKGLDVASEIAKTLVKNRVVIVSGLAEGIDTAAHRAAIESGGRTIAVLGTPFGSGLSPEEHGASARDHEKPSRNIAVSDRISHRARKLRHAKSDHGTNRECIGHS